eukprot:CAMPEP_0202341930 /NCGR_PEP_ID=MMETSP1126-20121109/2709_1 /ASSEMBLY_ACC=CAM_ASM_000457 /TAXON_ID=3047 /ORGANISM="Dunaliella tertiolecta, Strain CCMP1320" /LENGTH=107 /DNA_ID=CAMNT_0048932807 /DNA_START=688 /DNA_END=1010 /DNA_ORIENTATION=-
MSACCSACLKTQAMGRVQAWARNCICIQASNAIGNVPCCIAAYNFLPLLSFLADQSSCDCLNVEALELGRLLLAVENEEGMGAGALAGLLDEAQGGNECGLAPSMGL